MNRGQCAYVRVRMACQQFLTLKDHDYDMGHFETLPIFYIIKYLLIDEKNFLNLFFNFYHTRDHVLQMSRNIYIYII